MHRTYRNIIFNSSRVMKKYTILAIAALVFSSCGVGTYSLSSGKADKAEISFIAQNSCNITLKVDKTSTYDISTVKEKAYKSGRNIKKTALNSVALPVGKHFVEVFVESKLVYAKWVFISAGEHKIIEL